MDTTATMATRGIVAGSMIEHRYRLRAVLGAGAAAGRWRAADLRLHREVAITLCRPDGAAAQCDLARANLLAGVAHPALVTIFDAGIHHGPDGRRAYVVTELLEGQSLHDRLAYGTLAPRRIARIGCQIADALAHLHRSGVSHGAVSTANVILRADGTAKLDGVGSRSRSTGALPQDDVRELGFVLLAAFEGLSAEQGTRGGSRRVWRRRRLASNPNGGRPRGSEWTELLQAMLADEPDARPTAAEVAGRLAGLTAAPAMPVRERDEPRDVNDDVAPLSVGHWRAPYVREGASRSRIRLRGGRHRRAAVVQSASRDGDDAAA